MPREADVSHFSIPPSELTVILPVINEEENLPLLWPELIGVLDANWRHVEIIYVDDMSTDSSTDRIRELEQLGGGRRDLATHRQRPRST